MMQKRVTFYLPLKTRNDATIYYTELIKRAFISLGFIVEDKLKIFKASDSDFIVAITPADAYHIKVVNPQSKIMTWFQGIGPEEYFLLHGRSLRSSIMKRYLEFFEKKALVQSDISLFVSHAMQKHYQDKYEIVPRNYLVIPCYNKNLRDDLIIPEDSRYQKLKFVYAGGMFAWQCIDKTLKVFKVIENQYPDASLTLLTGEKSVAEKLLQKYKIKNAVIKYVSLNKLDDELSQYKYGFLLRDNIKVNNVATPTKMNSYLSVGILPIYSNVVNSFEENLNLDSFCVKVSDGETIEMIAEKIIKHHQSNLDLNKLRPLLEKIYQNYYNDDRYILLLKHAITKYYK
ncbi:hypothetical protein ACNFU2_09395 [Chryseobacterium sp. PTM-20240506]|uniref:hypothetical protein n=1 Tax=unclassified Chryseobacterium TaxID=2593645 RepID=UPI0023582B1E|nr:MULTISPECIES: hypothetical protein [unclassified Chryseobacterium]MDC8105110.1 hypothetical protein [Chryseobacterium sp. B21-037]MDQ1805367.1 hypothetical protein [Chryseobacterium sp. CKR4-1]